MNASITIVGDCLPPPFDVQSVFGPSVYVGNLECALTDTGSATRKAHSVIEPFGKIRDIAESGFAAWSLANNHVGDAGERAFQEMRRRLEAETPQQYYGLQERPFASLTLGDSRVAVIGCLERCRSRGPSIFREERVSALVREIRSDFDRILITPHWGKESEYAFHPSPRQRALAKQWIDAGADGVIGHHSHTIQGTERYRDKPVFYSIGSFLFLHPEGRQYPLTHFGAIVHFAPEDVGDCWTCEFLEQDSERVRSVEGAARRRLEQFVNTISTDLGDSWSYLRWVRAVGRIYHEKSSRSWRVRRRRHGLLRVIPLQLAWSLMPTSLGLRLGAWWPDQAQAAALRELAAKLGPPSSGAEQSALEAHVSD